MHVKSFCAIATFIFWSLFGFASPASAACTWYNLQNGNTADATQVMADFNCIHGNVEVDTGGLTVGGSLAGYVFADRSNTSNFWEWYSANNTMYLYRSFNTPVNAMSIDQNGNVGFTGTVTTEGSLAGYVFADRNNASNMWEWYSQGTMAFLYRAFNTGANVISVDKNGNVGIGTISPSYPLHVNGTAYATGAAGALSDARHKKVIAALKDGALQNVMKLRPVTFEWKEPKDDGMRGQQIGFIAQEVEEVFPTVVLTQNNAEKTKGLKYNELVAVMAKAIQELKKENDRESAVVADLKKQVTALQGGRQSVAAGEPMFRRVQIALGWH